MTCLLRLAAVLPFISFSCEPVSGDAENNLTLYDTLPATIREIRLPAGYYRIYGSDSLYANWLLDCKLKDSNIVRLYNGRLKPDQTIQFGVLSQEIGKTDLVQCADIAIKFRSDFLYQEKRFHELNFITTSGDELSFEKWMRGTRWWEKNGRLVAGTIQIRDPDTKNTYGRFMKFVYAYCGTYSLSTQLKNVNDPKQILPGDIFIQGGFPGHAVTVMAVARNMSGNKIFLLSQGFMPAQDIHILNNLNNEKMSPWFEADKLYPLVTPSWRFDTGSLKRW